MKNKILKTLLLASVVILTGQALLTSCNIKPDEDSAQATASSQTVKSNNEILSRADNNEKSDATVQCSYEEFKQYNIPKDVYNRITTSVYISDIEKEIGIPLLRKTGEVYYSVHSVKTEKAEMLNGFIMYNADGKVIDGWCTDTLKTKDDFSKLSEGSKMSDVNKIDPYCCFLENVSENTATSYHKTSEGKIYVIDYKRNDANSNYIISVIQYKDDPCNFINNLLNQDLQLIS